jgi:outer membrane lipoprotein-sorting protein
MRQMLAVVLGVLGCAALLSAQTAEELVARNLEAKGGLEKIKAISSLRATGRMEQGGFRAQIEEQAKAPDMLRENFTVQGMTEVEAYDGKTPWRISPFEGRRDPEMMGDDDARGLIESADFYGPLVDYKAKGNTIEYLGKDTIDGDDVYRLKVTLKNGDIVYYYLDPDTYLEIRTERQQFIRGSIRESVTDLGSYKLVNGVYYPFSIDQGSKNSPARSHVTIDTMEANVSIPDSEFHMPPPPATPSPQAHPEPPTAKGKPAPKTPPPPKPPV